MATLKEHQATMVSMLASGTAIPTSAIRLAHALHDVLAYLNDTSAAPVAHTERRIDATTPGLNDVLLADAIKRSAKGTMDSLQKQSEAFAARVSLESLLKQRDNTIRQLEGRVADLKSDYANLEAQLNAVLAIQKEPEQAGCRKEDTQCHHIPFKGADGGTYCDNCGVEL